MFFCFSLVFADQYRTIYEKLAGAFSDEQRGMYVQRVEEITPNISYCAYNLKEGTTDINDLMRLRLSATASGGTHDPVLTAKIDVSLLFWLALNWYTITAISSEDEWGCEICTSSLTST